MIEVKNYSKVVKITDILPDEAGGDGTDYLMNIEEVSFEGSHVTLVVDSWGHGHEQQMEANWNWQPQGSATKHASNIAKISSGHQHDMQGGRTPHGNKKFDLYVYTENSDGTGSAVTTSDGSAVYAFGITDKYYTHNGETTRFFIEGLAVSDGSGGYKEAMQVEYSGTYRGTVLGETIGHSKNPTKNPTDEIFGMSGDDVIAAGAPLTGLKVERVMIRYGWYL